jgi:acetolactate synthase-1/2/3 large subunit
MNIKVSEVVAEFLELRGIKHVFGIIGAGNVRLFDAIRERGYTEIVCVHHEQAACMAMQTYYRVSGKITACLLTTGGGSSNGVTGVLSAWADSIPGVVISGNENSKHTRADNPLRMWGVQGFDSAEMVRTMCKRVARLREPLDIEHELGEAFRIAGGGRPGPCWLDIPMDLQSASFPRAALPVAAASEGPRSDAVALKAAVGRTLDLLRAAERPVLWLGHGIRLAGGAPLIEPLLAALGAPSLVSWAGIDMVDSAHPLVYGRAGVYGQRCANFVLQNADLVVAIGTRLTLLQAGYEPSEFARAAKTVVVDIDPHELVKLGQRASLPVCADAAEFMAALLELAKGERLDYAPWVKACDGYRDKYPWVDPARGHADTKGFMNSYAFMEKLNAHFKPDQVVVTDMGTALLCGHQVLRLKAGQRLMTSTGLGEMGYGLPGAIGASFARGKGEVLCLNCDGGMMMNLQELQTVVHHALPIKIIVFNNDGYLMIKHTQKALFGKAPYIGTDAASGVSCPDFGKLAAAFGFPAFRIRNREDADAVLPAFQAHSGPALCEVFMDPEQLFFPKQSVAQLPDGGLVSPPLEDLSPLLPRAELEEAMIVGLHEKSRRVSG